MKKTISTIAKSLGLTTEYSGNTQTMHIHGTNGNRTLHRKFQKAKAGLKHSFAVKYG